jgi:uncharacterized YccA/Bax inhibitor family protein
MNQRAKRLSQLFVLYVSLASPAFAYLDAATGSIIIQAVIGAVGTWLVYSRLLMAKTKGFMKRLFVRGSGVANGDHN